MHKSKIRKVQTLESKNDIRVALSNGLYIGQINSTAYGNPKHFG